MKDFALPAVDNRSASLRVGSNRCRAAEQRQVGMTERCIVLALAIQLYLPPKGSVREGAPMSACSVPMTALRTSKQF
jgi:hypothetical protein